MKNPRITSRTWKKHGLKLLFDRNLRFRNPTVLNAASTNVILTNAKMKYPRVLTLEPQWRTCESDMRNFRSQVSMSRILEPAIQE